jgi:outer membrane protein
MRQTLVRAISIAVLAVPAVPALAEGKIGFVNTERIMRDSAPAQRAQKKIEGEFTKRDQELSRVADQLKQLQQDLEKNAVTMSDAQRRTKERELGDLDRDFQRKRREFQEDLNQRKNEELASVVERANKVIKQIFEAEKYDLILQEAVFAGPRADITDKVIRALNAQGSK